MNCRLPTLPLVLCALFTALSLLPGCAYFSREQVREQKKQEQRYDDAGMTTEIASALMKKDVTRANDFNIHCFNGHVFLVGEADKDFRKEARRAAQEAEGVMHVTTHWFPTGTAESDVDSAIKAKIESRAPLAEALKARRMAVDVWGGHVVLTGVVGKQADIDKAASEIKGIEQVRSVTSYLSLH